MPLIAYQGETTAFGHGRDAGHVLYPAFHCIVDVLTFRNSKASGLKRYRLAAYEPRTGLPEAFDAEQQFEDWLQLKLVAKGAG